MDFKQKKYISQVIYKDTKYMFRNINPSHKYETILENLL